MREIIKQMKNNECSEEFISYVSYILYNREIDTTCLIYVSQYEVEFTTEEGFNINIKD